MQASLDARAKALGMRAAAIGDGGIIGTFPHYESGVERYRAVLELFAGVAFLVLERRAKNPPPWELEIGASWPALAQGWGLHLDVRAASLAGVVRGRATRVSSLVLHRGAYATRALVSIPTPEGCELSLARQGSDGFFARLFRGQDIVIGDPAFDAAFVVKGEPEAFVRGALTPAARAELLALTHSGCSISLEDGKLVAWAKDMIIAPERVDALLKSAFSAATALFPEAALSGAPYR